MSTTKPVLIAALLCDQVLQEKGGVISAIRVIDRVEFGTQQTLPPGLTPVAEVTFLLMIKAGDYRGTGRLRIKIRTPAGRERTTGDEMRVELNASDAGHNVIARTAIPFNEFGLYWFDVYWNDELFSQTPLRVIESQGEDPNAEPSSD